MQEIQKVCSETLKYDSIEWMNPSFSIVLNMNMSSALPSGGLWEQATATVGKVEGWVERRPTDTKRHNFAKFPPIWHQCHTLAFVIQLCIHMLLVRSIVPIKGLFTFKMVFVLNLNILDSYERRQQWKRSGLKCPPLAYILLKFFYSAYILTSWVLSFVIK